MKKFMGRTMAKMNENRRNGRRALKGFTLVEIIVVLVILAILAAAMIPALTGYIDKARDRTIISEARNAVTAAQTIASEAYGLGESYKLVGKSAATDKLAATDNEVSAAYITTIKGLAEVPGTIVSIKVNNKCKVTELVYKNQDQTRQVTYSNGSFGEVADAS